MVENFENAVQWEMSLYDSLPKELRKIVRENDLQAHFVYAILEQAGSIIGTIEFLQNSSFISPENNI